MNTNPLLTTILKAIPSTEEATFSEFCQALEGDCPERGDSEAWGKLFATLRGAENNGLVEIDRRGSKIESLQLTSLGADEVRKILRDER